MTVESSQKLEVVTEDAEGSSFLLFAVVTFIEFGWLLAICLLVYLLYTPYFWITILAVLWQIWDRETPNRGGRRFPELRKSIYLRYLASYFPVQLKLTTTFEPENNYIFGYHPHGVVPLGSFCTFLTEALDISQKLPGMTIHYLTSHIVYLFPFLREFFMALGTSNVSEKNIRHLTKEKGNVVVIAIGGSAESMESTPGSTRLILRHRKGFVRMAIETGAHLVPVYGFGENDYFDLILDNQTNIYARKLQLWIQKTTGLVPVWFTGRWMYGVVGWIPKQRPVTLVVGKPIKVEKKANPSKQEIEKIHTEYINSLVELFENHKAEYGYAHGTLSFH